MTYRVEITRQALADAKAAADYIALDSPAAAARWFDAAMAAVASLSNSPGRCVLAPEAHSCVREVRQLLFGRRRGTYRILFLIHDASSDNAEVRIIAIRHSARRYLEPEELAWIEDD